MKYPLSVCTYNVHVGVGTDGMYDMERVARVAAGLKPDVICLQEIEANECPAEGQQGFRCRSFSVQHSENQPQIVASACGLKHVCFAPTLDGLGQDPNGTSTRTECLVPVPGCRYGNAIISRYPILKTKVLSYKTGAVAASLEAYQGWSTAINMSSEEQPRIAMACLIELPAAADDTTGLCVWIVNTHTSHLPGIISSEQKQQGTACCDFVATLVAEEEAPAILCGDFNSVPWQPYGTYKSLFEHAHRSYAAEGQQAQVLDLWDLGGIITGHDDREVVTCPSWYYSARKQWWPSLSWVFSGRIDHLLLFLPTSSNLLSEANGKVWIATIDPQHQVPDAFGQSEAIVASDHCAVVASLELCK
jgi:endonuclease/exonuclease/phosphatase family metal-dependent hydrolase